MTRLTYYRVLLEMTEQGGVTTPGPAIRDEPDALIDRDPFGRPHIPGTSMAGALRARVSQVASEEQARQIFGHVGGSGQRDDGTIEADASRLWVMNAEQDVVESAGDQPAPQVLTRWSTAIDRRRGAARLHTLRGVEMLPVGTRFVARLWLEDATEATELIMARTLSGWWPSIGRGVSSGHGRMAVIEARSATLDLGQREDLLLWLGGGGPSLVDTVTLDPGRGRALDLEDQCAMGPEGQPRVLRATIKAPLFVAAGKKQQEEVSTEDRVRMPLMRDEQPLLPGSSLKGVLRSRCEFILNTVGVPACLDQSCGQCHTCGWFGHGGGHDDDAGSVGARSKVRIPDALVTDAQLRTRTHVALDRWTGGVAQDTPTDGAIHPPGERGGKLYSLRAVERGSFDIRLEFNALPAGEETELFLATIALVIEDINAGLLAFGAATTRGYGTVEIAPSDWLPSGSDARALLKTRTSQKGART